MTDGGHICTLPGALLFFFSSRRRHTRYWRDWSSDVCSSDLQQADARWDICLIDCPPSLGLLTVNALVAARYLLVPLQCEFFALEGLSQLLATVERIRSAFNPQLSILGVVLTMFDRRNNLSQQVAEDVRACLGSAVFETVVPRNVRLSEAPSHGLPALIYDLKCPGSEAYIKLAREIMSRLPRPVLEA